MPSEKATLRSRAKATFNRKAALPGVAGELIGLLDLKAVGRTVRAGYELVSEGKPCNSVFLITDGIAIRYRILRDGQRQILNFLFPGDFAGVTSCRFDNALYSVRTLTQTSVAAVPMARLLGLFETHPRLAAGLFWSFSTDTAILAEHLIAIGRRSAVQRIAHLLLELHNRLFSLGLAEARSYRLPLTQEMISDTLGLSIPYVNRVLQQLRNEGLVTIRDQVVMIDNMEELAALADFEHTYLRPVALADFAAEPA